MAHKKRGCFWHPLFLLAQLLGERFLFLGLRCCYWLLRVGSLDFSRGYELDSGLGGFFSAAFGGWRGFYRFNCSFRGGGLNGNLDSGHCNFSHAHFYGGDNRCSCCSLAGKRFGFTLTATNFPWVVRCATSAANRLGNHCGCSFDNRSFVDYYGFGDRNHFCNDRSRCWLSFCLGFCWSFDAGRCWRSNFNNGFDCRSGDHFRLRYGHFNRFAAWLGAGNNFGACGALLVGNLFADGYCSGYGHNGAGRQLLAAFFAFTCFGAFFAAFNHVAIGIALTLATVTTTTLTA